jgi:glyoxylase-like metal-dependent hydrolase (beta-lactamase superfamily II)
MKPRQIIDHVYQVGSAAISDVRDGAIYLIDLDELVLIDSGAGIGFDQTLSNIQLVGFDPANISTVILTHCHMDHIGGATRVSQLFGSQIVMHSLDAEIVERGDQHMTAAWCFGILFIPFPIDIKLHGEKGQLSFGANKVGWIHIPGHTPGSIAVYLDAGGKRVLFGQDISAPLLEDFKCDPIAWRNSMDKILSLRADILCDGHAGVFRSKSRVQSYIQDSIAAHGFK